MFIKQKGDRKLKVSKAKIKKLINVSNNRYGIDTHYITRDGEEGQIIGSKKKSVIDRI